ncbi:MAG: tetratricopeptide repeat protein [Prevotella sp.]|nr:tetratricopeptide repeat protein [Prevotella sp.]
MGFFKTLFGGKVDTPEEKKEKEEARDLEVLISDGIRAMRVRQPEHAVKCFQHALEIKDDLQTRDYLAQALIQNDELRPAMEQLNILAEAQPDNIEIPILKARVAFLLEDYNTMVAACEQGLLIDKDNAEITLLYGRAAVGQEDYANAVAMFSKTIMLNSEALDAYLFRGQAYLRQGDVEGAADDADHLMEIAPQNEDVLLLKAHVLKAQEKTDEAIAIYSRMIDGNPFCVTAYQERAELKKVMGDEKGAEEDLAKVKEIAPPDAGEDMEEKVRQAYRNNNPFGLG